MERAITARPATDAGRDHEHVEGHGHGNDHPHEHHDENDNDHPLGWVDLVRIGIVALAVVASWIGLWKSLAGILGLGETLASFDVIALAATLAGGYPIFKEAVANLLTRRMTMELSM